MISNTKIYNKFENYSLSDCCCTACQNYKGKIRGCSVSECCCSGEKIKALIRECGLNQKNAERFAAENRGMDYVSMLSALAAFV